MTRAEFGENLKVAWDTLKSHKVRSSLTLLGIVIGVTSVISTAAVIEGLNRYIQEKVEKLGSRTFFITRFPPGTDPNRMPEKIRLRRFLEYSDAARLTAQCRAVEAATTIATRASFFGQANEIRYGSERVQSVFLRGAEPPYVDVLPMFAVEAGRFITPLDEEHASPVVVLGANVAEALFPRLDPLGKDVLINGGLYQAIGTFAHEEGLFGGPGVDDYAIIPLSNFRKHNPDIRELVIIFTVYRDWQPAAAKDEVTETFRRLRHLKQNADNDFEVISSDFLSTLWNQLTGAIVILTGVISSIGLLVGGIGVMNIMLISVTERTREIGVRKAIGARASDIRVQFLLEAITLTLAGGLIGILCGGIVAWIVRATIPSIPASLSWFWAGLGVLISASVGLFFGYWPADRAARLDPIVCLRYE
jgi:putative ABC transport system permease protein